MPAKNTKLDINTKQKNKKIKFNDDGGMAEEVTDPVDKPVEEEDYFEKREKQKSKKKKLHGQHEDNDEINKKWYHVFPQFPSSEEVLDIKEAELMELYNLCKSSFEAELPAFNKRNPNDARWLQTALHKGTAKDRANAGALLVTSNPLGNLEALSSLISYTKLSNKSSPEVVTILTDLWKEVLLPPHRKLFSLQLRGADWKLLRKDTDLTKEQKRRIYAYWYFENELKDKYFEFLKNIQQGTQGGQEHNKTTCIVAASQLLAFAPEKEQMLLALIVNKLGDPIPKIASKALHHLTEVAQKHPNMCGVIVNEAEKLLFRNNVSDRAQHFALCFLSSIAPSGRPEVCTKLVHICFALFKVLVQKGAVNSRTMQAILRCLQKAIVEAKPAEGSTEILSKDMQDTIYRLVHLADIRISVQTLGLLLQLVTVKSEKSDRFYNALYKKLLDLNLTNIGTKTAAQLLHIVHRAVHIDTNLPRCQAFIKRLLQMALYMPAHIAAGCLIVISKLLRSRKELNSVGGSSQGRSSDSAGVVPNLKVYDDELAKFDSDGEENYKDVVTEEMNTEKEEAEKEKDKDNDEADRGEKNVELQTTSSWHHAKVSSSNSTEGKVSEIVASKYDPYHRVPSFAGAEFAIRSELLLLHAHYHPTVQVFADSILNNKRIDYYGDPLRDFGLPHFLERFAFKNPKKLDKLAAESHAVAHKRYVAFGARGMSVNALTKANCTEDELFIFNYLEQKRQKGAIQKPSKKSKRKDDDNDEDADDDDIDNKGKKYEDVDDDEFEDYLQGFFGKKAKVTADAESEEMAELDFLKELGGQLPTGKTDKKKKPKAKAGDDDDDDEEDDDIDADWGDDDNEVDELEDDEMDNEFGHNDSDVSDDEEGSIDFNEDDEDLSEEEQLSDDEDEGDVKHKKSQSKKTTKRQGGMDERHFAKKVKSSNDMSSLFAAADDFAELLEETSKMKGHGTANAIFNKDKSSEKQIKWEEKRRSNAKSYHGKNKKNGKVNAGKGKIAKRARY